MPAQPASSEKTQPAWLPKIRLHIWRQDFYREAFEQAHKRVPDLTMSDWVRDACDKQAMEELEVDELPVPPMKYGDARRA